MFKRMTDNLTKVLLTAAVLCGAQNGAVGQGGGSRLFDLNGGTENLFGVQGQRLAYLDKSGKPTQPGKTFSEVLRGNGTRAGYLLTHGGILPDSVRVSVGARSLKPNVDYYLDYASGALFFAEPVRRLETVRVYYRYVEGQDADRSPTGLPGLALHFKGTSLNFAYGLSSGNGLDFTTYGLRLNSAFGSGSSLNGLLYFSTPAGNTGNVLGETRASLNGPPQKGDPQQAKSDHLIAQNLNLRAGTTTFRATYQDVGKHFSGFQAMRQSNANSADVLAQINVLEKERGVKRLGFGAGLQVGRSDKVGLDWDQIDDGSGRILRQSIGYKSNGLNFNYSTQSVGQNFSQFKGLREAEAAQWARERGVTRSDLTLGFAPSKDSALGFSQSRIGDKSGSLKRQSLQFSSKGLNFRWAERKADAPFARLNDLTDAEKTALALDIRRQFNPDAKAEEVTAKDKEQIALDAGLSRSQAALSTTLGKQSALAFNQFEIGDGQGSIQRRTFDFNTKGLAFHYLDQNISESFDRLGRMSDFERAQFANERGIRRTALGLNLALSTASNLAFSQLSLGDRDGRMMRQSFAYDGKGLTARLNFGSTDKAFARAQDLAGMSKEEKQAIESERGYRRMDFAADLTAIKGLTLNTFIYDARNAEDQLDKNLFRHNLAWVMNRGTKVGFLMEGNAFRQEGRTQEGRRHDLFTLDHQMAKGMKFNLFRDTVATVSGGYAVPTVTTDFLHFETDRSKGTNLLAETRRIDFGNGKFENTTQFDVNYLASKSLRLRFNRLEIDRGADPSADTHTVEWKWQISPTMHFAGLVAETTTNNQSDVSVKSFALGGQATKNLNFTGSYSQIDQHDKNVKTTADIAVSNIKPVNALGLKEVTFTGKYAMVTDQKRLQSEGVSGKVQGLLGKNQVAVEYGGALDPKGNSAISRTVTVVSDRSEKRPFYFDLLYKARNVNRSEVKLVRRYNCALKVDRQTDLTYSYTSLPEDGNGVMQPLRSSAFALKRALGKDMNLSVDYTMAENLAQKTEVSKLGALIKGRLNPLAAVEVGYSVDIATQNGQHTDAHTVTLGYDYQLDGDNFLTLSTLYTMRRDAQPDAIQANLEFKTRF